MASAAVRKTPNTAEPLPLMRTTHAPRARRFAIAAPISGIRAMEGASRALPESRSIRSKSRARIACASAPLSRWRLWPMRSNCANTAAVERPRPTCTMTRGETLCLAQSAYFFAHTAHVGKAAGNAIGHVSPQAAADFQQLIHRQTQIPQAVQGDQRGGAVRAAPAQPGTDGDIFGKRYARAAALAHVLIERLRRLHNQVAPADRQRAAVHRQRQPAGAFKRQHVGEIDALHEHIQFVIAVVAAGAHVQRPVDFRLRPRDDSHAHSPTALVCGPSGPASIIARFPPPRVKNRRQPCIF